MKLLVVGGMLAALALFAAPAFAVGPVASTLLALGVPDTPDGATHATAPTTDATALRDAKAIVPTLAVYRPVRRETSRTSAICVTSIATRIVDGVVYKFTGLEPTDAACRPKPPS